MVRDGKKVTGPEALRDAATGSARIRGDTLGIVGLGKGLKQMIVVVVVLVVVVVVAVVAVIAIVAAAVN